MCSSISCVIWFLFLQQQSASSGHTVPSFLSDCSIVPVGFSVTVLGVLLFLLDLFLQVLESLLISSGSNVSVSTLLVGVSTFTC